MLGRYRVLEKIGAGGMGVVYRARDERLERDVAIKVLPAGALGDESARRRFCKEALALCKLNHPNIETVYELDSQGDTDFLVLEYVAGPTVAQKLAGGAIPEKEVATLGAQVAAALEEAHEHGVVHRDLKPGNIMVTPKGQAKVLDFGLAKLLKPQGETAADLSTQTKAIAGTLPYMAPEQLRGEKVDARTDIFSLGVTLYEMATGRRPFHGDTVSRLSAAIEGEAPVLPRLVNPSVSAELERIILKCLEKDPENRYQSAKELGVDLRHSVAPSMAVAAVPARPFRTAWLMVPVAIALGAAVVGLLNPGYIRLPMTSRALPGRIERLAVLPLENFSHDPQQDYFADGMTDELTTALARTGALQVISRTSVTQYKGTRKMLSEIARELNADALIEGSVLRSGDRVRITAQLIHGPTDRHLWAESYEREVRDVLALQSEVAQAIARQVQVTLKPEVRSRLESARRVNPEAYETYLKGSSTCDGDLLAKAIQLDPDFGPAHAAVADCTYIPWLYGSVPPKEGYSKMKDAAARALEKDEGLARAHGSLALVRLHYEWDLAGSEREFRRALELNPNDADIHHMYAHYLLTTGRSEESVAETQRAVDLDPVDEDLVDCLGWHSLFARQYDKAIDYELRAIGMQPNDDWAHLTLGWAYEQKKMYPEAIAEFRRGMELSGGAPYALAALAHGLGISGKKHQAQELLAKLNEQAKQQYLSPYYLAAAHLGMGDKERALGSLQKAFEERTPYLVHVGWDPRFDTLHPDPRFRDLMRRIGLPI